MAVKLLYYFIFVFFGVVAFLLMQKPYYIEKHDTNINEPNIQMSMATNYSITRDGIYSIFNAKNVKRFADRDEFFKPSMVRRAKKDLIETISSNKAILVGNDVTLSGDVKYIDTNNVKFSSQEAKYNIKTKIFESDVDFILSDKKTITYGNSLVYQSNDGTIYAKNIKSISEVKDK